MNLLDIQKYKVLASRALSPEACFNRGLVVALLDGGPKATPHRYATAIREDCDGSWHEVSHFYGDLKHATGNYRWRAGLPDAE